MESFLDTSQGRSDCLRSSSFLSEAEVTAGEPMGANSGTRFRLVTASGTQESYGASVDTHEARFYHRRGGTNSDEKVIYRAVSQSARKWKDTMADHSAGYPSQSIAGAKRITESRACGTRIWATSCPISRADSNLNMPTYADHASLRWIKARRLARPLFPQNSHVHFFPFSSS